MSDVDRLSATIRSMVRLADTLVDDYDVVELLQRLADECHELVGATATAILLADQSGQLELAAASDDSAGMLELLAIGAGAGPCIEAFRSGATVAVDDLQSDGRWPEFAERARGEGLQSVLAVPMRLRRTVIGSMTVFRESPLTPTGLDRETAEALAHMATIGILHARAIDQAQELSRQLQYALDGRVIVEQAKGFLAYRRNVSMGEAFELLRAHARSTRTPLGDVARAVISRSLEL